MHVCGPDRLGFAGVIPERLVFQTPKVITAHSNNKKDYTMVSRKTGPLRLM